jgi:lipopolysaccharide export system permease protein
MRELALASLAATGILLAIYVSNAFIRLLGRAAIGAIEPEAVTAVLAFTAMSGLPVVLSVAMFFAVLHVLTRCYRDNEMTVWFASGLSLAAWIRPVLSFSLPVVLLIALMSLLAAPWSQAQLTEFQRRMESRDDVARVRPGVFTEARRDERVFFVDSLTDRADAVNNVFMQVVQNGRMAVMVARRAYTETVASGDKYVVFIDGRRYEGTPGTLDYRIIDFEKFSYRLEPKAVARVLPGIRATSTADLYAAGTREALAEVHWRVALPIMALMMVLLAIPLAFVNPRAGRSFNFLLAILLFSTYYNCMVVLETWMKQGKVSGAVGLWPVHGGMLLLVLALFWRRLAPLRWVAFAR